MIPRGFQRRSLFLGLLVIGLVSGGAVFFVVSRPRPVASLDGLQPLLTARQFDQAESLIRKYLQKPP